MMIPVGRLTVAACAASLALLAACGPSQPGGRPTAQVPTQVAVARNAAGWLAKQINAEGFVPDPSGTHANLSATAQTVLALTAANTHLSEARTAMDYLEAKADTFVNVDGADGPGQIAILILDAVELGIRPQGVDSNLVTRLWATQQADGPDAGLFGTETQLSDDAAGGYDQGLALAALAAAGSRHTDALRAAVRWLVGEQCPGGGWTLPDTALNSCNGSPSRGDGPDTNSTAMAVQGLVAQRELTPTVSSAAISFLKSAQDADAGWSYYPNNRPNPVTDPDSTALAIQALLAAGMSPTGAPFAKHSATPVSALLSFKLASGSDLGAFYYPPAGSGANLIATYQAVPALMELSFPWAPKFKEH